MRDSSRRDDPENDGNVDLLIAVSNAAEVFTLAAILLGQSPHQMDRRVSSTDDRAYHLPKDIGQPKVSTGVAIGESFMIEAKLMQDGRV